VRRSKPLGVPPAPDAGRRAQVAADPVWSGESDDMQVLMKRTVTADEEEYLLAAQERPPPIIKEVVKVRALTCQTFRTPLPTQLC
jgi:hypothetical protein